MRIYLCWFLGLLITSPASAAQRTPQEVAVRTPDGQMVSLTLVTGEKVRGRLFGVTREGVTIISGRDSLQSRTVPFAEIRSFKERPAVFRNILAGIGIAFLVLWGLAIVLVSDR